MANGMSDVTVPGLMWCVLELNMSIIGGSIPTLKPFLQRHAPRLLSLSQSKGGSCNTNYNIAQSRSNFGRLDRGQFPDWNTKSGTTASCIMSRSHRGDTPLSPITRHDTDELPLQGAIKNMVYYSYEIEGERETSPSKRYQDRIRPVLPACIRDLDAEAKVRQKGW